MRSDAGEQDGKSITASSPSGTGMTARCGSDAATAGSDARGTPGAERLGTAQGEGDGVARDRRAEDDPKATRRPRRRSGR